MPLPEILKEKLSRLRTFLDVQPTDLLTGLRPDEPDPADRNGNFEVAELVAYVLSFVPEAGGSYSDEQARQAVAQLLGLQYGGKLVTGVSTPVKLGFFYTSENKLAAPKANFNAVVAAVQGANWDIVFDATPAADSIGETQLTPSVRTKLNAVAAGYTDAQARAAVGPPVKPWAAGEQLLGSLVSYNGTTYEVIAYRANGTVAPGPTTTTTYRLFGYDDTALKDRLDVLEGYEVSYNEADFQNTGTAQAPVVSLRQPFTPFTAEEITQAADKTLFAGQSLRATLLRLINRGGGAPAPTIPTAPTGLTITREPHPQNAGEYVHRLSWNPVSGATSYTSDFNDGNDANVTSATSRLFYGFSENTQYNAGVKASNSAGQSARTAISFNTGSFSTPPAGSGTYAESGYWAPGYDQ